MANVVTISQTPALTDQQYIELVDGLDLFSTTLLFQFVRAPGTLSHKIIRNFIARGQTTLNGIKTLWVLGSYSDCWALHRVMLDRLFHLHVLAEKDQFEQFERWSFMRKYKYGLRILADSDIPADAKDHLFVRTEEHDKRYQELSQDHAAWKWSSPRAEDAAKSLGVSFLYRYGYDVGSRNVHPLADDGHREFERMTGLAKPYDADRTILIGNSILAQTVLVDEGLRVTDLRWRRLVSCQF